MRRCEELPWHLQICRRWFALKEAVAHLETFEMMYKGELKAELMSYWLLLSEGDLFVSDGAAKEAQSIGLTGSTSDNNDEELKRVLKLLDWTTLAGLTEKERRLQMMKNQVSNFDPVEEFNRSLESWVEGTNPSPQRLHHLVLLIGTFFLDFSRLEHTPPLFLRLGVDMNELKYFGIDFFELKDIVPGIYSGSGHKTERLESFITRGNEPSLSSESRLTIMTKKAKNYETPIPSAVKFFGEENVESAIFPTPSMTAPGSVLYNYLRWIWIQFPWLAIKAAAEYKDGSFPRWSSS